MLSLFISHTSIALDDERTQKQRLSDFDNWIDELDAKKKFSGVILIASKGKVLYSKAVGTVHPDKTDEITLKSSFNLASISKQFTAMGIMLLVQKKQLQYEDKIQQYLPEFPYKNITVRHLLNHTSGLPDYMDLAETYWDSTTFTNQDMLDLLNEHRPKLAFEPGNKFEYSNTGYVTLSALVERISKTSFEEYMDLNIFKPLNMNNSKIVNLLSKPNSLPTRVYGQHNDKLDDLVFLDGVTGDGGVYSTAGDLLKWHQALQSNQLLTNTEQEQAYKPGVLTNGELSYYGFGWFLKKQPSNVVGHTGNWLAFNAEFVRERVTDSVLVLLTNKTGGEDFWEVRERLISTYDQNMNIDYDSFFN